MPAIGLFLRKAGVIVVKHVAKTAASYAAKEMAKKALLVGVGMAIDQYLQKKGFPARPEIDDDALPTEPDTPPEPNPFEEPGE